LNAYLTVCIIKMLKIKNNEWFVTKTYFICKKGIKP